LAGDLDGTFAIARMQPCFQVAVKIATVVAARLRAGSHARQPHVYGGLGRPGLSTLAGPRPAVAVPRWASGLRSAGGRGRVPTGSQLSAVVRQIWGGSVIFGPLTGQLACSGVLAMPWWGAVSRARRGPFGGAVAQQDGSFVGSCEA